jgi:hypothetical protein
VLPLLLLFAPDRQKLHAGPAPAPKAAAAAVSCEHVLLLLLLLPAAADTAAEWLAG